MKPYATVAAIAIGGAPTEAVVPIVRGLRGGTGVSTGPGAVTLVNGLVGL